MDGGLSTTRAVASRSHSGSVSASLSLSSPCPLSMGAEWPHPVVAIGGRDVATLTRTQREEGWRGRPPSTATGWILVKFP